MHDRSSIYTYKRSIFHSASRRLDSLSTMIMQAFWEGKSCEPVRAPLSVGVYYGFAVCQGERSRDEIKGALGRLSSVSAASIAFRGNFTSPGAPKSAAMAIFVLDHKNRRGAVLRSTDCK